ncbi:hypothetical protein AURDEDRAFT_113349 [Auricularia subglabra TFB-10046 SS5]|nr:hypothetical protein AURDEDRAFT_113349 [Auricularia subglabra TFB-10046 SS5]
MPQPVSSSVASSSSASSQRTPPSSSVRYQQFDDHHSALEPFTRLILSSAPARTVRIHCTVPTWTSPDNHSMSLDDLHDLRTRALYFIHNLLTKLRAAGIQATYHLAPACGESVALRALPLSLQRPPSPGPLALPAAADRDGAFMASIDGVPTLALS